MPRVTHSGEPGTVFTNSSEKALYQFVCDWKNTCGQCAQYDHMVGPSWPIPMHRGCRCHQIAIWPGDTARPFIDYREKIARLDPGQRAKVVGVANLKLIESGTVEWGDVVTGQRVRDLREVVALRKLSVADMRRAGVASSVAEKAYESVHTPASELARQQREELIGKVLAKGVQKDELRKALAERLAARVGIVSGPSGPSPPKPPPSGPSLPKPPPGGPTSPASGARAKSRPKPKPPPDSVPVIVRDRADYLLKAKIKPDVVAGVIEAEAAARRTGLIPEIPDRVRYTKEVREEQDGKLREIAAERKTTIDAMLAEARPSLQAAIAKGDLYVRADSSTLKKVLAEGRFKTLFETGTSAGAVDVASRLSAEAEQFGLARETDPKGRPIYGYVSAPGFGSTYTRYEARLETYGDAVIRLKSDVRGRTTVTVGDSLGKHGMGYASDADAVDPRSLPLGGLNANSTLRDLRESADPDEALRSMQLRHGYVEAQFKGGLESSDIEEVAFTYKPGAAFVEQMEAKGIKWRVIARQDDD